MKSIADMIVSKMPAPEKKEDPGMMSASEDILKAIEAKNASMLSTALCSHYDMYTAKPGDNEEQEV